MVRFAFLRVVLIALFVLCQATWTLAGTTGNVEGTVRDPNGNPVASARVTMAAPSAHSATVTTSTNGFYSALNLSPDTYSVTASKDGFDPTTVYGVTVQADQTSRTDITMRPTAKVLARVTSTAAASVVSRSVTGDLYAVNSQAVGNYQGANGGAESLYSQNAVVGSLPGVVKQTLGAGGGYQGQGSLSLRGGSFDQVGYELDGVPLNRGFDFYNGTTFLTNGIGALEVYTGGSPASEGRAMSGFINEIIQRGKYPGGGDITGVLGSPLFNHSVNADVYGGTPDNRFTYYVSTLAVNAEYNYVNRSNQANTSVVVPANDAGCNAFNASLNAAAALGLPGSIPQLSAGPYLNCGVTNVLSQPQFNAITGSAPNAMERDTVANFHYNIAHNGLNDDVQALYVVGISDQSPQTTFGNIHQDPSISNVCCLTGFNGSQLTWLSGAFYRGAINQPYNPALLTTLTYPTANGQASGPIPSTFQDSNSTQYSIAKFGYTRALNDASFLRIYGYKAYSYWMTDAPINVGYWYQLHDNDTGVTLEYQNQLNQHNLLSFGADYSRDITLRHLYVNATSGPPTCFDPATATNVTCSSPSQIVTRIGAPVTRYSFTTPLNWSASLADKMNLGDKFVLDLGLRYDIFGFQLMPQKINGPNGLAVQAEETQGQCLHGYSYSPSDPTWPVPGPGGTTLQANCFSILSAAGGTSTPGTFAWQDAPKWYGFHVFSPRLGATYTLDPNDVLRVSAGRYVQAPNSAFIQYGAPPEWGPAGIVGQLNTFHDLLNFGVVHPVQPMDSTNYDLSWEHNFSGGLSFKATPYYRNTRNQVLNLPPNPANPSFVTGYNFGNARIRGAEFLLRKSLGAGNGIGGTLAATFTNSKIRFTQPNGGLSNPISVVNSQISRYNNYYGTTYPLLDVNGYYSPSYVQFAGNVTPSYDTAFVMNLTIDARTAGFDFVPTFTYQSGYPYGDPQQFSDYHCVGVTGTAANAPGCQPLPAGVTGPLGGIGPDPYTGRFDNYGAFKGPSFWTLNLGVSHDIGHNLKASILGTNLLAGVHNQGYAWEQPTNQLITGYSDNVTYSQVPAGILVPIPNPTAYYGQNYYGYAGVGTLNQRSYVFTVTAKI